MPTFDRVTCLLCVCVYECVCVCAVVWALYSCICMYIQVYIHTQDPVIKNELKHRKRVRVLEAYVSSYYYM